MPLPYNRFAKFANSPVIARSEATWQSVLWGKQRKIGRNLAKWLGVSGKTVNKL